MFRTAASQVPLDNIHQWLSRALPQYSYSAQLVVGSGIATGVRVFSQTPGIVTLRWAIPSRTVRILLTLAVISTAIVPGLVMLSILWLSVARDVERMKGEIATVLARGESAQVPTVAPAGSVIQSGSTSRRIGAALLVLGCGCASLSVSERMTMKQARPADTGWLPLGDPASARWNRQYEVFRRHQKNSMKLGAGALALLVTGVALTLRTARRSHVINVQYSTASLQA